MTIARAFEGYNSSLYINHLTEFYVVCCTNPIKSFQKDMLAIWFIACPVHVNWLSQSSQLQLQKQIDAITSLNFLQQVVLSARGCFSLTGKETSQLPHWLSDSAKKYQQCARCQTEKYRLALIWERKKRKCCYLPPNEVKINDIWVIPLKIRSLVINLWQRTVTDLLDLLQKTPLVIAHKQ